MSTLVSMKPPPAKNKQPSEIQITAAQILIDAKIHEEREIRPPAQRIMDQEELDHYKQNKRKEFEDKIRRQRYHIGIWVRYAVWEQSLKQFKRVRSIYERAIEVDYCNKSLWLKYSEFQMKHKFINHARNVWQRAIYYLPREDQFWYKYAYMQQLMGEYKRARDIFERWMSWKPNQKAWECYVKFQERRGNKDKAIHLMYRFIHARPTLLSYLKLAKYQIASRNRKSARKIFERIVPQLGYQAMNQSFFLQFSKFQIKNREYERAREIFKFGMREIPKEKCKKLYEEYLSFEKQHGKKTDIQQVVLNERRQFYQQLLAENELNYDAWINLLNIEMSTYNLQRTRQIFERAIKNVPPATQKRFWRRYIYIWYNYAVYQQLIAQDIQKTKQVYERILNLVPHKSFTFSELWVMYAYFHLRCGNIDKSKESLLARKIFGMAIGKAARPKIFRNYIELEQQLCNIDRVRKIYEKYIQTFPKLPIAWCEYGQFQKKLDEKERARGILQIANSLHLQGIPDIDKFIQGNQML